MTANEIDAFINNPIFESNTNAVYWLMERDLIDQMMLCDTCGAYMELKTYVSPKSCCDYVVCEWWCSLDGSKKSSIPKNSILNNFDLNPQDIVAAIHLWSYVNDNTIFKIIANALPISVEDLYLFNYVSLRYFEANPVRMGGNGNVILSDLICGSSQVSHLTNSAQILCFFDINSTPVKSYMEIIDLDDETSIKTIIERVIVSGTDFVSNVSLSDTDYNIIEAYWERHANIRSKINTCPMELLDGYLKQLMWQDRFMDNPLIIFCEHLKMYGMIQED